MKTLAILTTAAAMLIAASFASARVSPRTVMSNNARRPAPQPPVVSSPFPPVELACGHQEQAYVNLSANARSVSIQLSVDCEHDSGTIAVNDPDDGEILSHIVPANGSQVITADVNPGGSVHVVCGQQEWEKRCCTYTVQVH